MKTNLEPIDPETAVEMYLSEREGEVSELTHYSHKSRLGHFTRWCDENNIGNLNDITSRKLHEYRIWRQNEGDLARASLKTQLATLKVFIRWCESIDAVEPDLSTKILLPTLSKKESSRDVMIEQDRAEQILAYLRKYEYASFPHVLFTLLWHTMMRRGAARALDVADYYPDAQRLEVHHRPETGTPLKNKQEGERMVALNDDVCQILDDWITEQRPDVTDEYGRKPLLATGKTRIHPSNISAYTYTYTRPCAYGEECPHDRDPDSCEAAQQKNQASKCPSSVSPHAVRRGGITHWLRRDIPTQVVSDRANVSQDILDKHYDRRTEQEKMEQRRQFLEDV